MTKSKNSSVSRSNDKRMSDLDHRKLKAKIAFQGVRQNVMARDLAMDMSRLNRIVNGWAVPTDSELAAIGEYLGVSTSDFQG